MWITSNKWVVMNQNNDHDTDIQLFADLQTLSDSAFPKQCSTCGRIYDSPEDFFRDSTAPVAPTATSGLKESSDEKDEFIVELYRNCRCGSTLMDVFMDRRDQSERGLKRRALFGKLLDSLERKGMNRAEVRNELIGMMRGRPSARLEALGVTLKKRSKR